MHVFHVIGTNAYFEAYFFSFQNTEVSVCVIFCLKNVLIGHYCIESVNLTLYFHLQM